jgi:hypothetical protein
MPRMIVEGAPGYLAIKSKYGCVLAPGYALLLPLEELAQHLYWNRSIQI